jgi:hypothetical protein
VGLPFATAATFALLTAASAHSKSGTPYTNDVDIKMVVPSTISYGGNYQFEALAADS